MSAYTILDILARWNYPVSISQARMRFHELDVVGTTFQSSAVFVAASHISSVLLLEVPRLPMEGVVSKGTGLRSITYIAEIALIPSRGECVPS
jgi:hypothetical protein